jgi:hypothetical protein
MRERQSGTASATSDAVVVVEGKSDRAALERLAQRRGRDLAAEGVAVVPLGGAHALGRFLRTFGEARLAGLCDAGEERDVARALERAGLGANLTRRDMETLGFYFCDPDLEDELIRSLGPERVEEIIAMQGELHAFRVMQQQPAQRQRTLQQQLRRFMGTRSGRKLRYAPLLVDALDLANVPRPLDAVLAHVC